MKIFIDSYLIHSDDELNIKVSTPRIAQTGKKKGEAIQTRTTYHSTIEEAANELLKRKVKSSDANSLKELIAEVQSFKEIIRDSLGELIDITK